MKRSEENVNIKNTYAQWLYTKPMCKTEMNFFLEEKKNNFGIAQNKNKPLYFTFARKHFTSNFYTKHLFIVFLGMKNIYTFFSFYFVSVLFSHPYFLHFIFVFECKS